MKVQGYEFARGSWFQQGAHVEPGLVGERLEMLRKAHGGELTPDVVVADAKHNNSPLHTFFEWDDTEAARLHRLHQARGLIRAVVAVYKRPKHDPVKTRAYVHVSSSEMPHYRDAREAMADPSTREVVLKRALGELIAWKKRYKDLQEFASFIDIIERIDADFPKSLETIGD